MPRLLDMSKSHKAEAASEVLPYSTIASMFISEVKRVGCRTSLPLPEGEMLVTAPHWMALESFHGMMLPSTLHSPRTWGMFAICHIELCLQRSETCYMNIQTSRRQQDLFPLKNNLEHSATLL